jgi:hypothetical protein
MRMTCHGSTPGIIVLYNTITGWNKGGRSWLGTDTVGTYGFLKQ